MLLAEVLSGGAGWVGAGLLGAVLAWEFFVHIPAKDRMFLHMLGMFMEELKQQRIAIAQVTTALEALTKRIERDKSG